MDVRFCIRQEPPPRGKIALEGIPIRSNARSPKRARKTRAFPLTLTYMDVGISYKWVMQRTKNEVLINARPIRQSGTPRVAYNATFDRHRGGSHLPTPATPPCERVRTRRFEKLG